MQIEELRRIKRYDYFLNQLLVNFAINFEDFVDQKFRAICVCFVCEKKGKNNTE